MLYEVITEPMNILFLVDIQDPHPFLLSDIFNVELAYLLTPCAREKGKNRAPEVGRVQECVVNILRSVEDVFQVFGRA